MVTIATSMSVCAIGDNANGSGQAGAVGGMNGGGFSEKLVDHII